MQRTMRLPKHCSVGLLAVLALAASVEAQYPFADYLPVSYGPLPAHLPTSPFLPLQHPYSYSYRSASNPPMPQVPLAYPSGLQFRQDQLALQPPPVRPGLAPIVQATSSASALELPGYAIFIYYGQLAGFGSLITRRHVLVSGDGAYVARAYKNAIRVYMNTGTAILFDSKTEVRRIFDIYIHPSYSSVYNGLSANNVGIIRLDAPVRNVAPVPLTSVGSLSVGDTVVTYKNEYYAVSKFNAVIADVSDCASFYGASIDSSQYICVRNVPKSCWYQTGQPIVKAGVQFALSPSNDLLQLINSDCSYNATVPGLYVRVDPFVDWIAYVTDL